ncbi:ferredoxin [Blastococcus sp. SYSU D00813]
MTYVIAEPCVDVLDRSCVDACPVDCIYEGGRMAFIQPEECVDCGACVQVCPVEAIYYEDDLPEEWAGFTAINASFFAGVGSPGGTPNLPKGTVPDPPEVTALPPRPAED